MCHCLDKACISWGLAAQDLSHAKTLCQLVITYVRGVHLKFLMKFASFSFGENKLKLCFRVCPISPVLRSSEGIRLLDLIFRRQWPITVVEKSQDKKPEKPRNDSVQVQDKRVGNHSVYAVCTNRARIPYGKNKVRWAGKSKKNPMSELKQAGENKPQKCGHSQKQLM